MTVQVLQQLLFAGLEYHPVPMCACSPDEEMVAITWRTTTPAAGSLLVLNPALELLLELPHAACSFAFAPCSGARLLAHISTDGVLQWDELPGGDRFACRAPAAQLTLLYAALKAALQDPVLGGPEVQHVTWSNSGACMIAGYQGVAVCDVECRAHAPDVVMVPLSDWMQHLRLSPDGSRAVWIQSSLE